MIIERYREHEWAGICFSYSKPDEVAECFKRVIDLCPVGSNGTWTLLPPDAFRADVLPQRGYVAVQFDGHMDALKMLVALVSLQRNMWRMDNPVADEIIRAAFEKLGELKVAA